MSWRRFLMASLTESDFAAIESNLRHVVSKIRHAYDSSPMEIRSSIPPRLVAVSKTKPISAILAAYRHGQRHFGENYLQELITKSTDPTIKKECPEIRWHFIGHLQSNKANKLIQNIGGENLFLIETIDSEKCARKLNDAIVASERKSDDDDDSWRQRIMIQVNTSGESQKSGLAPTDAVDLAGLINEQCPRLRFVGFMTIGSLEQSTGNRRPEVEENSDFARLIETRREYCRRFRVDDEKSIELSMGMSSDYETAVRMGSTNVRIGSTIFGARIVGDQESK